VLPPHPESHSQCIVRALPPQGELVATPGFAGIHEPVTVRGEGFEPGKSYELNWTRVTGNRISAGGWEEGSQVVAQARADSAGGAEFKFEVPDDLGGAHGDCVDSGGNRKKTGTF